MKNYNYQFLLNNALFFAIIPGPIFSLTKTDDATYETV